MTTNDFQTISNLLDDKLDRKFKDILDDISYRIGVLYDSQHNTRFTSRDININTHMLDGFMITDNSPSAGSIAWSDCNVVFKGINYTITNGNTPKKYVWWQFSAVPNTVFQVSDIKPTLTDNDVLVCVNNAGTHHLVVGQGRMVNGAILVDGSVAGNELANNAVSALKIADSAVTATKIKDGDVTETKIGAGAITNTKLGANAVDSAKLADNAVTGTKILNSAVDSNKLADNAVTSNKIIDNAVTSTKIINGAVVDGKLGTNSVNNTNIKDSAVGSSKIADSAVIGAKIGAGAVATDKLNLAQHLLF